MQASWIALRKEMSIAATVCTLCKLQMHLHLDFNHKLNYKHVTCCTQVRDLDNPQLV